MNGSDAPPASTVNKITWSPYVTLDSPIFSPVLAGGRPTRSCYPLVNPHDPNEFRVRMGDPDFQELVQTLTISKRYDTRDRDFSAVGYFHIAQITLG
jgi:hypothetical protein